MRLGALTIVALVCFVGIIGIPVAAANNTTQSETVEETVEITQTPNHEFPSGIVVVDERWDGNTYTATLVNQGSSTESVLITDAGVKFESDDPIKRRHVVLTPGSSEHITFNTFDEPRLTIDDGNYAYLESLYRTWGDTSSDTRLGEAVDNPVPLAVGIGMGSLIILLAYHKRKTTSTSEGPRDAIR